MVGIALGVAGAQWAGLGAIGSTTVAGVLGSVVGSYLDAAYVMPALFGQDAASPNYGGLNISAADEGSPIWRVHGQSIRVPVEGISFRSRSAGGVKVFDTARGEEVVSVAWIADQGETTDETS